MLDSPRVGVIGAGAWGTALAIHLSTQYSSITLWGRNKDLIAGMRSERQNHQYLPGIKFPEQLNVSDCFEEVVSSSEILLIAIPSTQFRTMLQQLREHLSNSFQGIISAVKGFERETGLLLDQVAHQELPNYPFVVLSGPSFATEVARGLPTAITIAGKDAEFTTQAALLFHHHAMRAYTSSDVTGVELGGAFKNVLAIAVGIIDGLQFGANARAALITRGLAELMRLGERFGVDLKTLAGLAGVGDVVLSCTDNQSRNRRLGMLLANGHSLEAIQKEIGQVLEGQYAAGVICQWSKQYQIETPICDQVQAVLTGKNPQDAVNDLLSRSLRSESD